MSDRPADLGELLEVYGVTPHRYFEFDWEAVERSVGLSLPRDYKYLAENSPRGIFQEVVRLIRPGDHEHSDTEYLGYYEYRLEDVRRESDRHRLHPELGGLLPWGEGPLGELFFWNTEEEAPGRWTVVHCDATFQHWNSFDGSVSDFLTHLSAQHGKASFREFAHDAGATTTPTPGQFWDSIPVAPGSSPISAPQRLLEAIDTHQQQEGVDWSTVEAELGFRLPSDYRLFIDTFGGGTFCDVNIASPVESGRFGLYDLLTSKAREAFAVPRNPFVPPVFPEPAGMIGWGETVDGWLCAWAPTDPDPDKWGVVVARPDRHLQAFDYTPQFTFSSFLCAQAGLLETTQSAFLGRSTWTAPVTFVRPPH
ncbi:SMI1/KNR4 family protein [Streptomyces sp. NPDC055103]